MGTRRTVVIVGASLAGGRAAETLRSEGFDGRIVLIGAEPHPPYERPPLSKEVLTGQRPGTETYLRPGEDWEALGVDLRLGARVERLRPSTGQVELSGGALEGADQVLLCTGGHLRKLRVPGSQLPGVHYLRDLDSALELRGAIERGGRVVIIGGGFIGCEVAAAARSSGCAVTLLEATPALMSTLGRVTGQVVSRLHHDHGVDVRASSPVSEIVGDDRARAVVTEGGTTIEADAVVVGIGITPATELAATAGIEVANGVLVDEYCRTSIPVVYAAGDIARHPNPILGERVRLEQWANAQNQAVSAAGSLLGRRKPYATVPWFWSDQYDVRIEMAGLPRASDTVAWRGTPESVGSAAFFLRDGIVVGAVGFNRPREIRAAMTLIEARTAVSPDLLADENTNIQKLARAAREASRAKQRHGLAFER